VSIALRCLAFFASLTTGLVVAVGLPILFVWLLSLAQLCSFERALEATLSWPFLVAGVLAFLPAILRSGRRSES